MDARPGRLHCAPEAWRRGRCLRLERGVERLQPSGHVAQAFEDLLHLVEQQHAHALGEWFAQAFESIHGIPSDRRRETFQHFECGVRLSTLDFSDVLEAEVGELRELSLGQAALQPVLLQRRSQPNPQDADPEPLRRSRRPHSGEAFQPSPISRATKARSARDRPQSQRCSQRAA
jgi:hypothetical protein